MKQRIYSNYASQATQLLANQIKLARKYRGLSEESLSQRAGISRATLQKIEKGDMGCGVGLVFEVAALVGIVLFTDSSSERSSLDLLLKNKLALLPKRIQSHTQEVDDDF